MSVSCVDAVVIVGFVEISRARGVKKNNDDDDDEGSLDRISIFCSLAWFELCQDDDETADELGSAKCVVECSKVR